MRFLKCKPNFATGESQFQEIPQREKVSERFAHLFSFHEEMCRVEPVFDEALPLRLQPGAFALGNLILMMGKSQILPAEVDIERRAKKFHAHRAALDVPAGTAFSPWAG